LSRGRIELTWGRFLSSSERESMALSKTYTVAAVAAVVVVAAVAVVLVVLVTVSMVREA
jgi:hypothetical protein